MNSILKSTLALSASLILTQASAQVTFYQGEDFEGPSFTTQQQVGNFERFGFNDRASSVVVQRDRWEVCEDARFRGHCVVLRPGRYASLDAMGLDNRVSSVRAVSRNSRIDEDRYAPQPIVSEVTFYERENFNGRSFSTQQQLGNFERNGFNDRASSVVVVGGPWEVCDDARFGGRCAILRPGRYASLGSMGLNDRISSARAVSPNARFNDDRYAPAAVISNDSPQNNRYQRRDNERLYEANVTSVRAVVGTPQQRCWVESEQVPQQRSNTNVPGAIAGAVIGGILGHQVGDGRGKDFATAGGAIAGGVIGANVGRRNDEQSVTQDVQRCENVPNQARADYWDVTYDFRGQVHRVQMSSPPGRTLTVNEQGEPRS